MNRELNEPPFSGPGWKVSERDIFLAHIDEAIGHLGEAFRLAEAADLPYVLDMVGDAIDCAADARDDVVVRGW